jgi:aerobic carbon-monoxide dehydrogenase large subunit
MGEAQPLVGRPVPNDDGVAIVTGAARYTGDIVLPRMAYGRMVRSPYAHAVIRSIDAATARAEPGVLDVILPADIAGLPLVSTGPVADMPLLARGKVRYCGEPVAAVVAVTEEIAATAAELVEVDYEELPIVLDVEESARSGAVPIHTQADPERGNRCWDETTRAGDVDAAFAEADVVLARRFQTSKQHAMPMETHAAIASWDVATRSLTVWSSTQQAHVLQSVIASVFGIPQASVRVIKPFVGGAFGHKEGLHTHEAMAVAASRRLNRPVRFVLTRFEEFAATVSRNPQIRDVQIALRRTGEILGWRERIVQDVGAYSGLGPSVLALSEWVTAGPYRTPVLDIVGTCVYTNRPPSSAFRGFGNPQATFARELMFDISARELGMDPVEFRRRNLIRESDLPYVNANGLRMTTLGIERALDAVEKAISLPELRAVKGPGEGVGVVAMIEWGGGCRWYEGWDSDLGSVTLTINADASLLIATDAADSGQGHSTVFKQMAHDILGIPMSRMRFVSGDTASSPFGLGTYGSRSTFIHGMALRRAADELRERMFRVAAHELEADVADLELREDEIGVAGAPSGVPLPALAGIIHADRGRLPDGTEPASLVATASFDTPTDVPDDNGYGHFSTVYTCSATAAHVRVDAQTGTVRILDWASAEDVGRVLHPKLLEGQIHGGTAQGIGYALGETLLFDESGTLLNGSMVDYQVPTAPSLPSLEKSIMIETHDPAHPLGHKGIGESGVTPAAAAVACAVLDAIGHPVTTLPLTPERVLQAAEAAHDRTAVAGGSSSRQVCGEEAADA